MVEDELRPGEERAGIDPAEMPGDAAVCFIGHLSTPWASREDCPKNLRQAREKARAMEGTRFAIRVDAAFRAGLQGIEAGDWIVVLYWMHQARRDLVVQAPRHADHVSGVFSLRSPVRPNPIAMAVVKVLAIDRPLGILDIDAIDCMNGTPLIDIKPWLPAIDAPAND